MIQTVDACALCGTEFVPYRATQVYCSPKCRMKVNSKKAGSSWPRTFQRTYGITLEERDAMRTEQGHRCAICSRHEEEVGLLKVDHDHDTGAIRAMLCHGCNVALGHLQDNPTIVTAAAAYLIQFGKGDA